MSTELRSRVLDECKGNSLEQELSESDLRGYITELVMEFFTFIPGDANTTQELRGGKLWQVTSHTQSLPSDPNKIVMIEAAISAGEEISFDAEIADRLKTEDDGEVDREYVSMKLPSSEKKAFLSAPSMGFEKPSIEAVSEKAGQDPVAFKNTPIAVLAGESILQKLRLPPGV